jgi:hypothetical protein
VDARVIGPFRPAAYLTAYAYISLPNAFVATALQFSLASRTGRAMAGFLVSVFLIFMGFFVASFLYFFVTQGLGTLLDPVGMHFIVEDLAHVWTTFERNWRLLRLEGTLLANRLLWLGVAMAALALTYLRFRFAHRADSAWWNRLRRRRDARAPVPVSTGIMASAPISVPQAPRSFGFAIHARQTLAIAWTSFRMVALGWAGLALLIAIPMAAVLVVLDQTAAPGVPLIPTTALVIRELTGPLSAELSAELNRWLIVPLFIVFFAGELIWQEREAGLDEIADALPGSAWAPILGKFLGLGLVLALFMAHLAAAGMLAQAIRGYQAFEVGLYLTILFGLQLPEYLLFAVLALVVHVLVDQKYIGHLAAIMAYAFIAVLASTLGIEHNLLVYGAGPGWSYTEMRGFGASLGPWLWFRLYWAAWALLLAVAARLFWVRGKEGGFLVRLRAARHRLTRSTLWVAGLAVALILTLGGFIFYNSNVLNPYRSASDIAEWRAEYERHYRQYAANPQPRLTATHLHVEIYPEQRKVEIRGAYDLVNNSAAAIDAIHVATAPEVESGAISFDRPAAPVVTDDDLDYRIYVLERPLQPGDSLRLDFEVHFEPQGFRESGVDPSVAASGAYFSNRDWLPTIGYRHERELTSASDRREHGLDPRPLIPLLAAAEAGQDVTGEGRLDPAGAERVAFEAVVGTDAEQIAVAPGALRRTWTEGGRRYFHYVTDAPIGGEWAFFSADYAVHEATWDPPTAAGQPVAIRIFHHPQHTAHLERMVRSIRASLDTYTSQFGPYRHSHISVVEHPGAPGTGMHADASLISYGQGFPFLIPEDDPGSLDLPFAVVAHEMAHQWTVPYAFVEGAPVLSESLAWYYAMQVVEASYGREQLWRLLSFMREPYPFRPIRRGEPLLRGLDPYMSYRRGPFALFALGEYIGKERVNTALRRLVEKHSSGAPPLATTLDLYRELQAVTPESFRPLLHDLFEVNTFWEFETERVAAQPAGAAGWQVTLDVHARKVVVDEAGVETELPMDELVQIGVFAPAGQGRELNEPLYLQQHRIRSGSQTITVTAPGQPALAGIDPYHLLEWEEGDDDDNVEGVPGAN